MRTSAILLLATLVGAGMASDLHAVPLVPQSLASEVHDSLGIRGEADLLPPLAKVLAAWKDTSKRDASVAELVSVLNKGTKAGQLVDALTKRTRLDAFDVSGWKDWRWGTNAERHALVDYLWAAARQKTDPQQAAQHARASLLLAAELEFEFDVGPVWFIVKKNEQAFTRIAQLSDDQRRTLLEGIEKRVVRRNSFEKLDTEVAEMESDLIKSSGVLDPEKVASYLKVMERDRADQEGHPFQEWHQVLWVWRLKNLSIARKDEETRLLAEATIRRWEESSKSSTLRAWLEQARGIDGPEPHSRIVE